MTDKGAHYFRCDLQVHSPRDRNWVGVDRIDDADRLAYAAQLVHACRERGLQGIAITDHHDMAFVDFVRRAADDETDQSGMPLEKEHRLVVFPGMELTLSVPCQALLIFDADFPADMFALVLTALEADPECCRNVQPSHFNVIADIRGTERSAAIYLRPGKEVEAAIKSAVTWFYIASAKPM